MNACGRGAKCAEGRAVWSLLSWRSEHNESFVKMKIIGTETIADLPACGPMTERDPRAIEPLPSDA